MKLVIVSQKEVIKLQNDSKFKDLFGSNVNMENLWSKKMLSHPNV